MPFRRLSSLLAICTLFVGAYLLGGCVGGASDSDAFKIAIANEEPYGYLDENGRATGEAPEIARVIAKKLGTAPVEVVNVEWKALIPGLRAGRFDAIAAGMYITPERAESVLFTDPTYRIGEAFLVAAGNPKGLHSYQDIVASADAQLGVVQGTVEVDYAKKLGVPDGRLTIFADNATAALAVKNDQVDAFAGTALTIQTIADKYGADSGVERAEPFEQPVIDGKPVYGYGAFAFAPDNQQMRDRWNAELVRFIGSAEHLALVEPFGFTAAELPGKTMREVLEAAAK